MLRLGCCAPNLVGRSVTMSEVCVCVWAGSVCLLAVRPGIKLYLFLVAESLIINHPASFWSLFHLSLSLYILFACTTLRHYGASSRTLWCAFANNSTVQDRTGLLGLFAVPANSVQCAIHSHGRPALYPQALCLMCCDRTPKPMNAMFREHSS